eukprot:2538955-Rhodomonas_salina.5
MIPKNADETAHGFTNGDRLRACLERPRETSRDLHKTKADLRRSPSGVHWGFAEGAVGGGEEGHDGLPGGARCEHAATPAAPRQHKSTLKSNTRSTKRSTETFCFHSVSPKQAVASQ